MLAAGLWHLQNGFDLARSGLTSSVVIKLLSQIKSLVLNPRFSCQCAQSFLSLTTCRTWDLVPSDLYITPTPSHSKASTLCGGWSDLTVDIPFMLSYSVLTVLQSEKDSTCDKGQKDVATGFVWAPQFSQPFQHCCVFVSNANFHQNCVK